MYPKKKADAIERLLMLIGVIISSINSLQGKFSFLSSSVSKLGASSYHPFKRAYTRYENLLIIAAVMQLASKLSALEESYCILLYLN